MSIFRATSYLESIDLIPASYLTAHKIQIVLVDRDNTCVPRSTRKLPQAVRSWFYMVQKTCSIPIYIVSNNTHTKQVEASAAALSCKAISHAMKPSPRAITRLLKQLDIDPAHALFVGDQVFTDIVAANLSGCVSVLVRPQSHRDLWYTYILRAFEFVLLRHVHFLSRADIDHGALDEVPKEA